MLSDREFIKLASLILKHKFKQKTKITEFSNSQTLVPATIALYKG